METLKEAGVEWQYVRQTDGQTVTTDDFLVAAHESKADLTITRKSAGLFEYKCGPYITIASPRYVIEYFNLPIERRVTDPVKADFEKCVVRDCGRLIEYWDFVRTDMAYWAPEIRDIPMNMHQAGARMLASLEYFIHRSCSVSTEDLLAELYRRAEPNDSLKETLQLLVTLKV